MDSGFGNAATRDEAAPADLPGNQALGFEQFVSCGDGGTVQSKLTSQFTSGW